MIGFITGNFRNATILVLIALVVHLWQSNKILKERNKVLTLEHQNKALTISRIHQERTITTQQKVIDLVKNTKPVDFDINLKRMRNNEL